MIRIGKRPRSTLTALALLLACTPALADKPTWTPIAELLVGSIGEADPVRMSNVLRRCTALNMTLAGLVSEVNPEMSHHYESEALSMIQNGVLLDSQLEQESTGIEADIPTLSDVAIEDVRQLLGGYSDWLDDNMSNDGSYFNKDFEMEMDSCQLASRLVKQMQVN